MTGPLKTLKKKNDTQEVFVGCLGSETKILPAPRSKKSPQTEATPCGVFFRINGDDGVTESEFSKKDVP